MSPLSYSGYRFPRDVIQRAVQMYLHFRLSFRDVEKLVAERGVTEVRAGVFMFGDLVQAGGGSVAVDDIALSVLATVIGHRRDKGWIITDAGWMALSRDRCTARQALD